MKRHLLILPVAIALSLSACGGSNSDPLIDDSTPTENPDVPDVPVTQADLPTPDFRGELIFSSVQSVALGPLIQAAGLSDARYFFLSRDGQSVRAEVFNDAGDVEAIAHVDTNTGVPSWLATEMGATTHLLFDAENQPVAVYASRCGTVSYTPHFDNSLIDLSTVIGSDSCIFEEPEISAEGNVVVFYSYAQGSNPYESNTITAQSYSLNTARLTALPNFDLPVEGLTLTSMYPGTPFGYDERILSDDGQQFFFKHWWSGTDANGGTHREVGAVLWDTNTNDWQVRGQAADLRGCIITEKVSCNPPYFYAMSTDGSKQYFSIPTIERLDVGGAPTRFQTELQVTQTGSPDSTTIAGIENIANIDTNRQGSLVLIRADYEDLPSGYALYQYGTQTIVSVNRALQGCALQDEAGNAVDDANCEYNSPPGSVTNDAERFTADGQHLLFRSVSRFSDNNQQAVDDFLLDAAAGAMHTLPLPFSANPAWVNGDASILLGGEGATYGPDFELLIGKR